MIRERRDNRRFGVHLVLIRPRFIFAAAAEDAMADGLLGMAGEGLTTSEVADLCELTVGEVQKLVKRRREATAGVATAGVATPGVGPVTLR